MISVLPASPPAVTNEGLTLPLTEIPESQEATPIDPAPARAVSAREEIRMGRAVSMDAGINWLTMTVIVAFHLGAVAALFFFTWQRLTVMLILYFLAINLGIGMCYHRLLTHRGYQVPKWLEYVMATCATLAPMSAASARSFSTRPRLWARLAPWKRGLWARKSRPPTLAAPVQWPLIRPRDSTP